MKEPIFIAHRGAWKSGRRENTASAVERAASSGRFAYIEMDVRRTRSDDEGNQTPILMHDETLDRLYELNRTPKSKRHKAGQAVYGLTLDIIRNEEIEVSTLMEAMRAANGNPLNIEIKTHLGIEPTIKTIAEMINKYPEWSWEKIVFSSFDWSILYEVRKSAPQAGVAMLYTFKNLPRSFGRTYRNLGARWIMFNKWLAPVMLPLAKIVKVPHTSVYVVNNPTLVRILQLFGAESFTTDNITLPDSF